MLGYIIFYIFWCTCVSVPQRPSKWYGKPSSVLTAALIYLSGSFAAILETERCCPELDTCETKENCPYIQTKYEELLQTATSKKRKEIVSSLESLVCNKQRKAFCCPGPEEGEKFYKLNGDGHFACNKTADCPPMTRTPFTCNSEKKNGEMFHSCQADVYEYICDRRVSVCKETVCAKNCHSSEDYQPREIICGREYGCIEECSDPRTDRCTADGKCPEIVGGVVPVDVSAAAYQSTKLSRSRNKCPHGTCKRRNVCCQLSYFQRRRIYVCPHSCG